MLTTQASMPGYILQRSVPHCPCCGSWRECCRPLVLSINRLERAGETSGRGHGFILVLVLGEYWSMYHVQCHLIDGNVVWGWRLCTTSRDMIRQIALGYIKSMVHAMKRSAQCTADNGREEKKRIINDCICRDDNPSPRQNQKSRKRKESRKSR